MKTETGKNPAKTTRPVRKQAITASDGTSRPTVRRSGKIDTETDRIITVVIKVPFFGKQAQARKFVEETLPRILRVGLGTHVTIEKYGIKQGKA